MTVGKDVSALFPDVVNCMQTDNLELKKLVYLYLMNYAKSQPDMAIMAVNTFVKVSLLRNHSITADLQHSGTHFYIMTDILKSPEIGLYAQSKKNIKLVFKSFIQI